MKIPYDHKKTNQCKVEGRGYGYVGVSRFRHRSGLYLFGRLRRSDFLPVVDGRNDEVIERGVLSESSDDEEDGPRSSWENPLVGRMHGLEEDSDTSEGSAASQGSAASEVSAAELPVSGGALDIDFA